MKERNAPVEDTIVRDNPDSWEDSHQTCELCRISKSRDPRTKHFGVGEWNALVYQDSEARSFRDSLVDLGHYSNTFIQDELVIRISNDLFIIFKIWKLELMTKDFFSRTNLFSRF